MCANTHNYFVTIEERIQELEKSHDQLRRAVVAAGLHIRKFRGNPKNERMVDQLRNALRDARVVRRRPATGPQCARLSEQIHGLPPIQYERNFDLDSML